MKRALVLGPGGLAGAFSGGVVATLGRVLGYNYFSAVYGCSAGAYTGAYLVSGQPEMAENIWRECVHGNQLMRWHNIFNTGQPILDLFYLNKVLMSERYRLSVENLLSSSVKILIVATDCQSGSAHYFSPKTSEEFFLQVRASAAVPYLHPKVLINGRKYAHGGLSDRLPVEKALADGYNEIVVVSNYSSREFVGRSWVDNAKVKIICSSVSSPLRWSFDSSEDRINQLVDLGISSAIGFIESQARR